VVVVAPIVVVGAIQPPPTIVSHTMGSIVLRSSGCLSHDAKIKIANNKPDIFFMVRIEGFEPSTPWSQTTCAAKLRHIRV
jgi:hypothetical protein